jgi:hypothetical protein
MKADPGTQAIFIGNLRAAERAAGRLASSTHKVVGLFPLSGEALNRLGEDPLESLDAFMKRFEQLQDLIENKLFRGVAYLEQEDISRLSKRDLTVLMEKLGVIESADQWSLLSILRNKLAHEYPGMPVIQASRLNEAFEWSPYLSSCVDVINRYVSSKRLLSD